MKSIKNFTAILAAIAVMGLAIVALAEEHAHEHEHFDIAPYFQGGALVTGGLDHDGHHTAPNITVYPWEFGEDIYDPFNPSSPGVNQAAGVGNLPAGASLRYNILSSLMYWDGSGEVEFTAPASAYIDLTLGNQSRTIAADSGAQAGSYIQTVMADGSLHKHFTSSLYAASGSGNIPGIGDSSYAAPDDGVYAFAIELVLNDSGSEYSTVPLWMVFNNGLDEELHEAAMEYFVPEPASMTMLAVSSLALAAIRRRQRLLAMA